MPTERCQVGLREAMLHRGESEKDPRWRSSGWCRAPLGSAWSLGAELLETELLETEPLVAPAGLRGDEFMLSRILPYTDRQWLVVGKSRIVGVQRRLKIGLPPLLKGLNTLAVVGLAHHLGQRFE